MHAIETRNLRVWYGDNEVIKGVNLQVPPNGVFASWDRAGAGSPLCSGRSTGSSS